MSLTLLSRPTSISKWVAAKNPLVYSLQRKDYIISLLDNASSPYTGRVRATITGVNATADFKQGDIVYISSAVYTGVFNVFVNSSFSGGNTQIIFAEAYTSTDAGGGFINTPRRVGYYVSVKVFDPSNVQIGPAIECFGTPSGLINADVWALAREFIFRLNEHPIIDPEESGIDQVSYQAVYSTMDGTLYGVMVTATVPFMEGITGCRH